MKKIFLTALILLSGGKLVFAQEVIIYKVQQVDIKHNEGISPGKTAKFTFYFKGANKMILEFESLQQVDSLPNLDSLLSTTWTDLQFLVDSLPDSLASRRIDYIPFLTGKRVNLREHPEDVSSFLLRNGEVTQLRTAQDSLRIHLYTRRPVNDKRPSAIQTEVYYVTLVLNNISQLPSFINTGLMSRALELLKNDINKNREMLNKYLPTIYRGQYNVSENKVWESINRSRGEKKSSIEFPIAHVGLQFVNGYWTPSFGAGFDLVKHKGAYTFGTYRQTNEKHFQLLWQPHFFFESDSAKSFRILRNDFITFRYHNLTTDNYETRKVEFRQTASFGYLIRRKGDYFGPTTFKFSLPGLQTKSILLEPEFVFNKFFKNFSPSLKLLYLFGEDQ